MYVAYPSLCCAAAVAFHLTLSIWGNISNRVNFGPIHSILNWGVLVVPLAATLLLSISRVLAVTTAYSAPMEMYTALAPNATGNLCLGKEWYRFPSSYFLPEGVRARWIKSAFSGLLPGQFDESGKGWERPGLWTVPEGMNDLNIEDPGKYVCLSPLTRCVPVY